MKKVLFCIMAIMVFFILYSCDNSNGPFSQYQDERLIGYWRSENTFKDTYGSSTQNWYNIYIFQSNNKVANFYSTSFSYIKDTVRPDDWWDSYTADGKNIIITSSHEIEPGYEYTSKITLPYYFSNDKLVLTLSTLDAGSMGLSNRTMTFIKF